MNLLQALQKTQTQRAQQPVPGQAANLRKMLAAKASGKAGTVTGPAMSNIGEQQALSEFNQQATQQQQVGQVAADKQQLAAQAQQTQQAQGLQRLDSNRSQMNQQYSQGVKKIKNDLDRVGKDIESKEGRLALNEAIFARRLADKDYMTTLDREGKTRRLEDAQQFQIEAGKMAFDNWNELFADEREFAKAMQTSEAEWKKKMERMGIQDAQAILSANMEADNRQAKWSAGGSFVSALAQGAIHYSNQPTEES